MHPNSVLIERPSSVCKPNYKLQKYGNEVFLTLGANTVLLNACLLSIDGDIIQLNDQGSGILVQVHESSFWSCPQLVQACSDSLLENKEDSYSALQS